MFGNYPALDSACASRDNADSAPTEVSDTDRRQSGAKAAPESDTMQSGIHRAVARSFVYRYLAQAYEHPTAEGWRWLTESGSVAALVSSAGLLGEVVQTAAENLWQHLRSATFDSFLGAYLTAFGHAARGSCPLNEIEYGDIKADPLFQPHRLADLAAFYRAFGLEITSDAGERHDHLSLELEFLCVLAAKDAYAHEYQLDSQEQDLGREAQRKFLREHLGRWTPAFARRLAASTDDPALRGLAEFTRAFVESECRHFGVIPGSEELALRPVDGVADRMCDACGLPNLPPGALSASDT